jgi:hypothetical protein
MPASSLRLQWEPISRPRKLFDKKDVVGSSVGGFLSDAPRYYPRKVTRSLAKVTNDFVRVQG